MKKSSKLIVTVLTVAAIFFSTNLKAQTTPANAWRLGFGIDAAEPTGNARIGTTFILGGTGRLQYGINNSFALTLTSGAYHFFPKTIPGTNTRYNSYGVIPIKLGIKEFFVPNIYFDAEAGVGFEETDAGGGPKRLILSPALGYANTHWDAGVRYENFSGSGGHYGMAALRIAYGFGL
jgi:hypothetical protein